MSGLACKSLGMGASFAKSLISHIMKQTTGEGDKKMSMSEYMEKVKKGSHVFNPALLQGGRRKYAPKSSSSVSDNPLNANANIDLYQDVVDRSRAKNDRENKTKSPRSVILNIEANILNSDLAKFFPKIEEAFSKYSYKSLMMSSSTVIITTAIVSEDGTGTKYIGPDGKAVIDKTTGKPILLKTVPLVDSRGNQVMVANKAGKMVPAKTIETDLKIITYDPMGMGRGPDSTVAENSIAADEIIIGALMEEAELASDVVASEQKTMAEKLKNMYESAVKKADSNGSLESFDNEIITSNTGDSFTVTLKTKATIKADRSKLMAHSSASVQDPQRDIH